MLLTFHHDKRASVEGLNSLLGKAGKYHIGAVAKITFEILSDEFLFDVIIEFAKSVNCLFSTFLL